MLELTQHLHCHRLPEEACERAREREESLPAEDTLIYVFNI